MHFIKSILGRVFALWAALFFVVTMLIVLVPMWLIGIYKEPRRSYLMQAIYHTWMRVFFFLAGIRLHVKGRKNFQPGQNYIVVFNHNSLMDVPVSVPFMPGANKTIAKAEMARMPLFGLIYRRGSVLVDRRSDESRKASYGKMRGVLELGLHMCIYPEGTRNKTPEPLQRFHDGAFRLAMESGKPVPPALIFHTATVLPRRPFFFWPGKIDLHYLAPVSPTEFSSAETLKNHVFQLMQRYYISGGRTTPQN